MQKPSIADSHDSISSTASVTLWDVFEVAKMLACSTRHVRRMADAGTMPSPVRLWSAVRWRRSDIERWIQDDCPNLSKRKGAK
jgi:excisionase family DNA binding protein